MDKDTLVLILRGHHLDMAERIERGIWPHPPLKLNEVIDVLAECIRGNEWFPRRWEPPEAGRAVDEVGTIQRVDATHFIYRAQRAHPTRPTILADAIERPFPTAEEAAR